MIDKEVIATVVTDVRKTAHCGRFMVSGWGGHVGLAKLTSPNDPNPVEIGNKSDCREAAAALIAWADAMDKPET
jgi:hypothetical protein